VLSTVNIVLIVLLAGGLFWGWQQGIVKLFCGAGAIVGGIWIGRYLTPFVITKLNIASALNAGEGTFAQQIFVTQTYTDRLIEVVVFLLTTAAAIFVLRMLGKLLGDMINAIPLLGSAGRALGSLGGIAIAALLVYVASWWLLPLLAQVTGAPVFGEWSTALNNSIFIPYITALGDTVMNMVFCFEV